MDGVAPNGLTTDTAQMLLACVLLGGYALCLGRLLGTRGRIAAAALAAGAALVFVLRSSSWEAGVVMVALMPLGVGLFAASAWVVWALTGGRARRAAAGVPALPEPAPPGRRARGRVAAWLQRT